MRSHSTLDDAGRVRLARLLGMLGSQHDGEALNAARMADRLVRAAGCTWADVIALPTPSPSSTPSDDDDPLHSWPGGWRNAANTCLRYGGAVLTAWEKEFCANLSGYVGEATARQRTVLRRLLDKVLTAGDVPR